MDTKKLLLAAVLTFNFQLLTFNCFAQTITQEWLNTINGNIDSTDGGMKVVLDTLGNVYVSGFITTATSKDYLTVKYNAAGSQLWSATYNGTGNADDVPRDMVLDEFGNVYVTGLSFGNGTLEDFATVKYDANGVEQWVKRYDGTANGTDFAAAITISPAGFLVVTGRSRTISTGDDYLTIKYDLSGNVIWINSYNYIVQNGHEKPADVIVDQNENCYITGRSVSTNGMDDYLTIKIDASGNVLWNKRYNGSSNDLDLATHLVLDSQQNPIVTGYSSQSGQSFDIVTIKYDAITGNQLALHRFNGGVGMDIPNGMVIDNADNVYITGYSFQGSTGSNFATLKYNPSLTLQWSKFYDGTTTQSVDENDRARAIAIDSNSNVYITGSANNIGTLHDITTIKYNNSGVLQWVQTYSGAGNGEDIGWGMALSSGNEVYIVGESIESSTTTDFITIKYSQPLAVKNVSFLEKNITVFPNPTNGNFTILLPTSDTKNSTQTSLFPVLITVLNLQGTIVFETTTNLNKISVNLSNYSKGIYLIKIQTEQTVVIKKIIHK